MSRRKRSLSLEESFHWYMPGDPPEEGCWEWKGQLHPWGYGTFSYEGKKVLSHRVAYELYKGEIPLGMHVLHDPALCNNPPCVNPAHLRVGTPQENHLDQDIAGTRPRGERHGRSKLTEGEVEEIRRRYAGPGLVVTQIELAREYGVSQSAIDRIVRREHWKHTQEEEP